MRFYLGIAMSFFLSAACNSAAPVKLHALDSSPSCFPSQFEDGSTVSGSVELPVPFLSSEEINTASVTPELLQSIRQATSYALAAQITRASRLSNLVRDNPVLEEWDDIVRYDSGDGRVEARSLIREENWGLVYSAATSVYEDEPSTLDFVEIRYTERDTLYEFTDAAFRMSENFVETSALIRGCDPETTTAFEINQLEIDGTMVELTLCWVPSIQVTMLRGSGLTPEEYMIASQLECRSAMNRILSR